MLLYCTQYKSHKYGRLQGGGGYRAAGYLRARGRITSLPVPRSTPELSLRPASRTCSEQTARGGSRRRPRLRMPPGLVAAAHVVLVLGVGAIFSGWGAGSGPLDSASTSVLSWKEERQTRAPLEEEGCLSGGFRGDGQNDSSRDCASAAGGGWVASPAVISAAAAVCLACLTVRPSSF